MKFQQPSSAQQHNPETNGPAVPLDGPDACSAIDRIAGNSQELKAVAATAKRVVQHDPTVDVESLFARVETKYRWSDRPVCIAAIGLAHAELTLTQRDRAIYRLTNLMTNTNTVNIRPHVTIILVVFVLVLLNQLFDNQLSSVILGATLAYLIIIVAILVGLCVKRDTPAQPYAISALAYMGDVNAIPHLITLCHASDRRQRVQAVLGLIALIPLVTEDDKGLLDLHHWEQLRGLLALGDNTITLAVFFLMALIAPINAIHIVELALDEPMSEECRHAGLFTLSAIRKHAMEPVE